MNDLKFAFRQLRKNPGFAAVAVLTLALCLGANLTIFAVVDAILLRPLPFPESARLVSMFNSYPVIGTERAPSSFPNLYSRRDAIDAFSHVAAYNVDTAIVGNAESTERKDILRVSADFFAALGVGPIIGRAFSEVEMTFQTHHVAILSEAYWRQRFNSDPAVVGKEVRVNGFPKTIVGVLPPGFRFLSTKAQIVLPLSSDSDQRGIDSLHNPACQLLARLKPGATLEQAQIQVDAHNKAQGSQFPYEAQVTAAGFHSKVVPLHQDHVAGVRPVLVLLQASVLFLLLIGGVNLVNLLLVRSSARTKELAIRQSMGATHRHIVGQVLTESVLLAVVGGLCGLVVGAAGIRLLTVLGMDHLPMGAEIALDGRPAWVALFGAVMVGIVVAIPIAWFKLRGEPAAALQAQTRGGTTAHAAQRLRHGFIVAQIALAFVLITGAGLLGLSLKRVMEISPGFQSDHVLAGHVSLLHKNYLDSPMRLAFAERLVHEISNQPGVTAFGVANDIPVNGADSASSKRVMTASGQAAVNSVQPHVPNVYGVFGDYFAAMGIPVLNGRSFEPFEFKNGNRVCIVDEIFAHRYWPRGESLGKLVYDGPEIEEGEQPFTIVGVVGAVKQTELTEQQSEGAVYFPGGLSPLGFDRLFVVTRTAQRPETFGPNLQKIVRSIEPELPLQDLRSMDTRIADSLQARRSPAMLAAVFGGIALALAAIGTYGVLSYAVAQRRREIGVRMALGALPSQIGRHFLMIGLRLLVGGIALGMFGAWAAGRTMQSLLFNVPSLHFTTLTITAVVLGLVSLVACLLPTLRASRVDPMEALRNE